MNGSPKSPPTEALPVATCPLCQMFSTYVREKMKQTGLPKVETFTYEEAHSFLLAGFWIANAIRRPDILDVAHGDATMSQLGVAPLCDVHVRGIAQIAAANEALP